jgi:hypothetical protein
MAVVQAVFRIHNPFAPSGELTGDGASVTPVVELAS